MQGLNGQSEGFAPGVSRVWRQHHEYLDESERCFPISPHSCSQGLLCAALLLLGEVRVETDVVWYIGELPVLIEQFEVLCAQDANFGIRGSLRSEEKLACYQKPQGIDIFVAIASRTSWQSRRLEPSASSVALSAASMAFC